MAFLQPGDVMDDGDGSSLDASVVAIDAFVAADGGVLEIAGFLLGREEFDVIAQRALIALQGQNVVRLLVQDLLGDVWQPMASMVTIAPSMTSIANSLGMATISLALSATLTWPSAKRWRAAKAETM